MLESTVTLRFISDNRETCWLRWWSRKNPILVVILKKVSGPADNIFLTNKECTHVHCHMYTVHMYTYLEKIYIIIRLTERNHNTTLDCSRTIQSLSCRGCTDPSLSRGWSEKNTSWRVLSCSRCSRYSLKLPLWITRLKGHWMRQMKNVIDWLNLFIIELNRLSYYQTTRHVAFASSESSSRQTNLPTGWKFTLVNFPMNFKSSAKVSTLATTVYGTWQ